METLNNNRNTSDMSMGPGLYRLEDAKLKNKISYVLGLQMFNFKKWEVCFK